MATDAPIQNARPSRNAPEVRDAAIEVLAKECTSWTNGYTVDDWKALLAKSHLNDNGFEIARDLDRYHCVSGIDLDLVEILDGASSALWTAHDRAVEQWVAETNPTPAFEVGQRVRWHHGQGTISRIYAKSARYVIVPDGEEGKYAGGGGHIVDYEHVSALEAEASA